MTERLRRAAHHASTIVRTKGLLAEFNDAGVLGAVDVAAATTICRLLGEIDESVALAAALTVRGTRFGHVCIRLESVAESVIVDDRLATAELPWPDPTDWRMALEASVLTTDADAPLVMAGDRLYLERYYRYERLVAEIIMSRLRPTTRTVSPASVAMAERLLAPDGEETSQLVAARRVLSGALTVVAGGPGTGKTHTIGVVLAALAAGDGDFPLVGLCAPTGKAAARLGEAILALAQEIDDVDVAARLREIRPSTIHRLLGRGQGRNRFTHHAGHRLPHDVVIVDEMSMVSLPMAARLMESLADESDLVLVGDPFQLESIEAGTVLADIVGPDTRPDRPIGERVVVLDRAYRFDHHSAIADFADAVRTGDADAAESLLGSDQDQVRWVPDASHPDFDVVWRELVGRRCTVVEAGRAGDADDALDGLNEMALLCAHRDGPHGVAHWGRQLESALDEHFPGLRWDREWYPGRPVMITRNDYHLELFNGDIGVVVSTEEGLRAVFDRGEMRRFPLSHLTEHTTVHALTIHKSQGSQFRQVVVLLPDEDSPLLTRQLLYTAVTRAADRVWLVGSRTVIRAAVTRSVPRASGLGELLWE